METDEGSTPAPAPVKETKEKTLVSICVNIVYNIPKL